MSDRTNCCIPEGSVWISADDEPLDEIDRIAAKYGVTREEVLLELLQLDLIDPAERSTLH